MHVWQAGSAGEQLVAAHSVSTGRHMLAARWRAEVQAALDEKASRWRQEFEDHDDEVGERKDVASRWQQCSTHVLFSDSYEGRQPETQAHSWQFVVEQFVTTSPGNFGLGAWVHKHELQVFQLEAAPASRWQRWEVELDDVGWQGEHAIQGYCS